MIDGMKIKRNSWWVFLTKGQYNFYSSNVKAELSYKAIKKLKNSYLILFFLLLQTRVGLRGPLVTPMKFGIF